jgi:hypothetical protein
MGRILWAASVQFTMSLGGYRGLAPAINYSCEVLDRSSGPVTLCYTLRTEATALLKSWSLSNPTRMVLLFLIAFK